VAPSTAAAVPRVSELPEHLRQRLEKVPPELAVWSDWVLRDTKHLHCPRPFLGGSEHFCFWPSRLHLVANSERGKWNLAVMIFEDGWVPLPGSGEVWPLLVNADGQPIAVVERDGHPAVRLTRGVHALEGEFAWARMPQRIAIPAAIGLLSLEVDGAAVPLPNWDADGFLWLKRARVEQTSKDMVSLQVYRLISDGVPMWLDTQLEITVSGKSREEQFECLVPEGWKVATVSGPLPLALDETGRVKVQVRSGKWTMNMRAFRVTPLPSFGFAEQSRPLVESELIGFRSSPGLRTAELAGVDPVDVTQTTFPSAWRDQPVYRWQTAKPFQIVEKMRGMGEQRPPGLKISRQLWLDSDGRGFTYRDQLQGAMQHLFRLDVADSMELGVVRQAGENQLITANPQTEARGVELRRDSIDLEAIGRTDRSGELSATGWQADAETLNVVLTLPPGWRLFALFGADRVSGDWLTAWTLLDLFLLLIFSLAATRLWGYSAGVIAFLGFALAYHEPGSPRTTWFVMLIPLALLRVVPEGYARKLITAWKYVAVTVFVLNFVPFVARQVQTTLYPQLERPGILFAPRTMFAWLNRAYEGSAGVVDYVTTESAIDRPREAKSIPAKSLNLNYESQARIQTGPAAPQWSWNQAICSWNGPVSAQQRIRPILISLTMTRCLNVLRLLLLGWLVSYFITQAGWPKRLLAALTAKRRVSAVTATTLLLALTAGASIGLSQPRVASAQIPDAVLLDALRQRLLEPSDAFPRAAEIAAAKVNVEPGKLVVELEVHVVEPVAVPLPGRLPDWSPVSVKLANAPTALVTRHDGYLWIYLPAGIQRVTLEGRIPVVAEWQWTYLLKPRSVTVSAPGWTVAGLQPNGLPEEQLFFSRVQPKTAAEAAYDQKHYHAVVVLERTLEIGLVWKVHNQVTRLTERGKAVAVELPLLADENVLTPGTTVREGLIEVRLGANDESFSWESELPIGRTVELQAAASDRWVERWRLLTSPVWNVSFPALQPIFESSQGDLVPTWHPWPGEEVTLAFTEPKEITGETVTVQSVRHVVLLGSRQRNSQLSLQVESSLGGDFNLELSESAEISALKRNGRVIPVRRENGQLKIPLAPGKQTVELDWVNSEPFTLRVQGEAIRLPVEGANVTSVMQVPEDRWVLWASGPLLGPAVRFWTIIVCAVLVAIALGGTTFSPLSRWQWVLLALGLTQVHIAAAVLVVGWLFLLTYRGRLDPAQLSVLGFNILQVVIVGLTVAVLGVMLVIVGEGLLGQPEMFIAGNGSTRTLLNWFESRVTAVLPTPSVISVSIWFYRILMLLWALWLATALLRWLMWGWRQLTQGGAWRSLPRSPQTPPVLAEMVSGPQAAGNTDLQSPETGT
jgi:hypothetical protein